MPADAPFGLFLTCLSDAELACLSRACEELDEGQASDAVLDDLSQLTRQALTAEHCEVHTAEELLEALMRLSLYVSLAKLHRLGFIETDIAALMLTADTLPPSQPTEKAGQLLGQPLKAEGVVLH